ncbi:MAG: alpha,alpha-trehalase [Saprospiraceae bacterium]|jgi:alpha,alpha-trehalase
MKNTILLFLLTIALFSCRNQVTTESIAEQKQQLSPDERYGELFEKVQFAELFADSKTFADCNPKFPTDKIVADYENASLDKDFDLQAFVNANFIAPSAIASDFKSDTSKTTTEHINALWDVLTRQPDASTTGTLIPLPNPYVVPGGRFREVYYWDSYFTMLGLQKSERWDLIENMVDNFSYLIETMGFIPNGNRTYYQGRSQPPFYSLMVKILAEGKGDGTLTKYLPYLQKEYDFWMDGAGSLKEEASTYRRAVRLSDGTVLNRYWDDIPTARPESYREDVALVKSMENGGATEYRHIRAAAESGWDFSSRWFKDGQYMSTIHTTEIIPVDLNALMYHLETTLTEAYLEAGNTEKSAEYSQKAEIRKKGLNLFCWNEKEGFYKDYDFVAKAQTEVASLAAMYPLYFNMAEQYQADSVAKVIERDFLQPGGVTSTLNKTSQQWDAPNGWAPLQWISIQGLRNYEHTALADTIKTRWVDVNVAVYKQTGKMVEKYNVYELGLEGGGGEYPVQDGFGWTNGVLLRLLSE